VEAPERLRGGLIFEAKFEITAIDTIAHPTLVLAPGWLEGMSLNTAEPGAESETSRDGSLHLRFARLPAGEELTLWTQWQANPVDVGHRPQDVALYDGSQRLASIERDVTVFP
jgi:hypothetical protein